MTPRLQWYTAHVDGKMGDSTLKGPTKIRSSKPLGPNLASEARFMCCATPLGWRSRATRAQHLVTMPRPLLYLVFCASMSARSILGLTKHSFGAIFLLWNGRSNLQTSSLTGGTA